MSQCLLGICADGYHIVSIALSDIDIEENRATTSMLHNAIKSNWILEQLNWTLCDPGDFKEYDGLTSLFIKLVKKDKELFKELKTIKGIGNWTAKKHLLFVLKRDNVLSYEDEAFL